MRNRTANWMIAALLIVQLAIGLPWQAAHATAVLPEHSMSGMQAGHCPGHQSNDSTIDEGGDSSHDNPAKNHDCCRSLGCQCHSAQSPGVLNLPLTRVAFSSLDLLPTFDARPPVTRTTELFRPPIA
jgi:hypothetical protein